MLCLNRSLHGLRSGPRNFLLFLKGKLEEAGFAQSTHDACMFTTDKVICLVCVDDTLFFAKDRKDIDEAIQRLKDASKLEMTEEDDFAGFLGVMINRLDNGQIELTQPGLIERIINALDLGNAKPKNTPAGPGTLGSDKKGMPPSPNVVVTDTLPLTFTNKHWSASDCI